MPIQKKPSKMTITVWNPMTNTEHNYKNIFLSTFSVIPQNACSIPALKG